MQVKEPSMTEINTVLGPVSPDDLGFTLMHEHVMGVEEKTIRTLFVDNPRRFFSGD